MRGTNDNSAHGSRYNNTFDHNQIHQLKLAKRTLQYWTEGSYYEPSSDDVIRDAQFWFQFLYYIASLHKRSKIRKGFIVVLSIPSTEGNCTKN